MAKPLKVLIVEDDEDDAVLLVRHLRRHGFAPRHERVETVEDLQAALRRFECDVVLCDYKLPKLNALTALQEVTASGVDLPFIVVSGEVDEERLVELMKAGAHDIIVKNRLSRLAPAINREIEEASDRRKRMRAERQLREAIESISEGFVLFDAEDRLIICNAMYRWLHERSSDVIVPGARFEDIIRTSAERGECPAAKGRIDEWVAERLEQRRNIGLPTEHELPGNRWVLISERRTRDGGKVGIHTDITSRKNAEEKLQESEAFLRLIADNLPIVIAYFDTEQRYRFINRTGAQWYARAREEVIGKSVAEVLGEAGYASLETHLDRALRGDNEAFEASVMYPDGAARQIQGIYVPDRDGQGEVKGFIAMTVDITDRHLAESALRRSEQRFRDVAGAATDWIWEMDKSLRFTFISDRFQEVTGVAPKQMLGRTRYEISVTDKNGTMWAAHLADLRARRPFRDFRYTFADPAGDRHHCSISGTPIFDSDGAFCGYRGTGTDLTAQVEAGQAHRESEERFRGGFETAPHGMALVNPDGRWLKVNRALCKLVGYSEEELLQIDFQTITHPDDLDADVEYVRQVLAGEIPSYQMEKRYICKDGKAIWILLSVSLVRDASGVPLHFVAQILDLTGRKETEAQLVQAQKMEAVGQLTGGVAHDFNNLLTVIMGNARLLERRLTNDAAVSKQLAAISGAARRGVELTNRLLAFSRKENLEPKAIDGVELVSGMLDMLRRTLGETIEIHTRFADEPLALLADPNQLEAALLNLATNARDAMPNGGTLSIAMENVRVGQLNLDYGPQITPGEYVMLSISDTGNGIPAEQIDRIYEPFFTTKEVGKGTGLGLSMVFGFVQRSGGHIQVDSEVAQGTTFRLYLPKAVGMGADQADIQNLDRAPANAHGTILVVEDEPAVRDVAATLLEDLGFRIIEAENGPDALVQLDRHRGIDLLFTDIVMPGGMTGFDLAERARERNPGLKVLFTTGYADGAAAQNGGIPDGATIVAKPYEDAELAEKVEEALRTRE